MSWTALRFQPLERLNQRQRAKLQPKLKMTRHHVPPKHPDRSPRIIKVDERHHAAYHMIFGAAATMEDCIAILRRDWWPLQP